jgi:hypothetical protein
MTKNNEDYFAENKVVDIILLDIKAHVLCSRHCYRVLESVDTVQY